MRSALVAVVTNLFLAACGSNAAGPDAGESSDGSTADGTAIDGASIDAALPPVARGATLAPSTYHTCVILTAGGVKCWGWNEAARLGLGDTIQRGHTPTTRPASLPALQLGTGRTAVAIAAGGSQTCAILDDKSLRCWGSNVYGQLGRGVPTLFGDVPAEMGDAMPPVDLGTGRTAIAVAAGEAHTCALLDDGHVKCWGRNDVGQLGLGDLANRGDALGEMGDALPVVDLGTGRTARAITVGRTHACAILDTGKVKCWGTNGGKLGIGDVASRGDNSGEMGDALPVAELGTGRTAKAITAGEGQTCAILDDDSVKCWGTGFYGELGYGDMVYRGDNPGEMGDALAAVALGTGHTARAIVAGGSHTCAVREDRSLVCWGSSNLGALGRGSQGSWGAAPGQMGDALVPLDLGTGRSVVEVVSGNSHLCAKLDDASLKCWGWAAWGQLGLGDVNNRGEQPGEMGNALPVILL